MRSRKRYSFFGWKAPPIETASILAGGALAMALTVQPLATAYNASPIATANLMVDVAMNTYAPVEDISPLIAVSGEEITRAARARPSATIPGGVLILDEGRLHFFQYESEDAKRKAQENRLMTAKMAHASTLDDSIDALGGFITRNRLQHQNLSYDAIYEPLDKKSAALDTVRERVPNQERNLWSVVQGIAANFSTIPSDFVMRQEDYAQAIEQYGSSGRVIGTWRTMGSTQGRDDAREMQLPNEYSIVLQRGKVDGEERIRMDIYFQRKHQVLIVPAVDLHASTTQGF